MAYRRPAVTVIQEFVGLQPALALFNLPSCVVGPAYQLVDDDLLGTYSDSEQTYGYASLQAGATVDLDELTSDELFPATKKPIAVQIKDAKVEIVAEQTNGVGVGLAFTDATADVFEDVQVGDLISIVEDTGVEIVAAQTDGETNTTDTDRLTAGTAGQFANVKAGDSVVVTGGTNTNTGTFTVLVKISDDVIKVNAAINDGGGASTDVAYSITGDRGTNNVGDYKVKTKTDSNTLELESPLIEDEAPITYSVKREVSELDVARVASHPGNGFLASAGGITLPAGLTYEDDNSDVWDILEGTVYGEYRALRNDLTEIVEYEDLTALQAAFGLDQITPANPLAFGLSIMLSNTVTAINGLGLDENAVSNETLSYTAALETLGLVDMYALVPLTQSPAIHQLFKTHVEGFSQSQNHKERVAIVNRLLKTIETLQDESTTSTNEAGSRVIVNTQVDGTHDGADLDNLNDATTDQFLNVKKGDTVVIQSGTDVTPGSYTVNTVTDANNLVLSSDFASAGGGATDIQYYIIRKDGLGANGTTFYDRNGSFISDGVAAGHYVNISAPTSPTALPSRHKITAVTSEKELEVEQVEGVAELITGITYELERDMTKSEQAAFVEGYSSSIGSRRIVNTWPDILKGPVGNTTEDLPGYYGGCAVAAMTTGLPTQQGFTNLTISGFLGFEHSTKYFTDSQLDTIANGGTFIFAQAGEEQPLYIRHQLTTDRSSIKFQEFSVTKNVDFASKFIRNTYTDGRFIGEYNIIDTTKDELKLTAKGIIEFLRDTTKLPKIGGVIKSGVLTKLEEDETNIDTISMRFKCDIPIPLNNLDITLEV